MQGIQNSQNNHEKEQSWKAYTHNFNTYYKYTVIKTVWWLRKFKNLDQWNGIESLEISSYIYGQLIFNKGSVSIYWGKKPFQQMVLGQLYIPMQKKLNYFLTPHAKIYSEWIIYKNLRAKTIKLLEEIIIIILNDV